MTRRGKATLSVLLLALGLLPTSVAEGSIQVPTVNPASGLPGCVTIDLGPPPGVSTGDHCSTMAFVFQASADTVRVSWLPDAVDVQSYEVFGIMNGGATQLANVPATDLPSVEVASGYASYAVAAVSHGEAGSLVPALGIPYGVDCVWPSLPQVDVVGAVADCFAAIAG